MTTDRQREHLAELMDLLVDRRAKAHYAQVRPMRTNAIRPGKLEAALRRREGITVDCSESVTLLCRLAGLRDPNGLHYNGEGNTSTLMRNLEPYVDVSRARIGALWVVGGGYGLHVAMVRRPHPTNPLLFSHGCELDPRYFTLAELVAAFPRQPWTFRSIAGLGISHHATAFKVAGGRARAA